MVFLQVLCDRQALCRDLFGARTFCIIRPCQWPVSCFHAAVSKFKVAGIIEFLMNLKEKAEDNAMHDLAIVKDAGAQVASCKSDATAAIECKFLFET